MKYLRELRKARGLSQQNVANFLEITRQAYSNYENGNRAPDNETLLKLGEYFDVSVDQLLRGGDQPAPRPRGGITDQQIMEALFPDDPHATREMYEELRSFAKFLSLREEQKRKIAREKGV